MPHRPHRIHILCRLHDSCADTEGDVSECHASALNEAFADANWYSDTGLLPQMVVIALVDATFLVGNEVRSKPLHICHVTRPHALPSHRCLYR